MVAPVASDGFPSTRWTLILACRDQPERHRELLTQLLGAYWQPLYVFLRKRGLAPPDAEDALQGFAERLLRTDALARLDPGRGKLRAYLKTAIQHHLQNIHAQATAERRGGGQKLVALDSVLAERLASQSAESADDAYQRAWAAAVFDRALGALRIEFESGERRGPFKLVEAYFRGAADGSYAALAAENGLSVPQLKSLLHRARARFRELLRSEIADTVADASEIDAELKELSRSL